jgi:hypothetical protein
VVMVLIITFCLVFGSRQNIGYRLLPRSSQSSAALFRHTAGARLARGVNSRLAGRVREVQETECSFSLAGTLINYPHSAGRRLVQRPVSPAQK